MNFFDFLKYKLWLYDSLGLWFYRQQNKLNALGSLEIYDPVTWFQSYESYFDFTKLNNQSINQLGLGDKIGFLASMIKTLL